MFLNNCRYLLKGHYFWGLLLGLGKEEEPYWEEGDKHVFENKAPFRFWKEERRKKEADCVFSLCLSLGTWCGVVDFVSLQ